MVDETEDAILKGKHIGRILEDAVYREAVNQLEKDLFESWKATSFDAHEKREFIYRQFKAVGEVELRLRVIHENGKVAEDNLKKLNKSPRS